MNKLLLFVFLVAMGLTNCKNKPSDSYESVVLSTTETKAADQEVHPGKKLMETQCYLCHSPSAPEKDGRIGPPMIAIKAHYINNETTKEAFTQALWHFVEKPTVDKAKLRGAVRRFGVMPYQPFKKEDIAQIAEYLFDYQIEEPDWFKEHWENGHKRKRKPYINTGKKITENSSKTKEDIGLNYALGTKKVLGENLMGTIQTKGVLEALAFCNQNAYALTDSMATQFHAAIKRVSDKPRNSNNKANTKELAKITYFKNRLASGKKIEPIVEKTNNINHFYYPIITNSMCLQCHGKANTQIKPEVLLAINNLYPKDLAKGYDVNQVRGMWSIRFKDAK